MSTRVRLDEFNNDCFKPGRNNLVRALWYVLNLILFKTSWLPFYGLKRSVLRLFGAKVGRGVVVKPNVNIKYPWKLEIGEFSWIGEEVWIDNLDQVSIGAHVCISQGALILNGNHNFKSSSFDLMVKPIRIGDGAWLGAKSTVTQGVSVGEETVLAVNSVASSDLDSRTIYRGNPALKVEERTIE